MYALKGLIYYTLRKVIDCSKIASTSVQVARQAQELICEQI